MKVLVITAAFPPMRAGEADHAFRLCQHLSERGFEVHALTTVGSKEPGDQLFRSYPIMRDWSWSDLPRLVRFVNRCSPDVVLLLYIGWIYNDHPMITFAPTICRALVARTRFVTLFEFPQGGLPDRWSVLTRGVRRVVQRWADPRGTDYEFGTLLRDSDQIIVLSNRHRARLLQYSLDVGRKCVLVPPPPLIRMTPEDHNGFSRQQVRARLGLHPYDFLLAYFGYIYPFKGVETLFRALQIVTRHNPNVRLIIIGGIIARTFSDNPTYAQDIRDMPKRLGIDDKIIWIGEYETDSDEASLYLRAADACVFAHDDGVYLNNSSFVAAAAHGLPIIATQGSMIEEPFVHGDTVFLCPPRSPEDMAAAITSLVGDAQLRECLRKGALKLAQEWFSWGRAVDRIASTFRADCQE